MSNDETKELERKINLLAETLGKVLQKDGILNDIPVTAPELIMAAEEYLQAPYHKALSSPELEKKIRVTLILGLVKIGALVTVEAVEPMAKQLLSLLSQSKQDIKLTAISEDEILLIWRRDWAVKWNVPLEIILRLTKIAQAQLAHNLKEIGK